METTIKGFITGELNPGGPSKKTTIKTGLFCPIRCQYGDVAIHKMAQQIRVGFRPLVCCACGRKLQSCTISNEEPGWIDITKNGNGGKKNERTW